MRRTHTTVLALAIAVSAAGAPAYAQEARPVGAPVAVISSEGGFMAPGFIKSALPSIAVYANGAILTRFEAQRRPDLREMRVHAIDPKRVRALLTAIANAAVRPKGGWGFPGVADVPSTRIRINSASLQRDISVYALSFTNGGKVSPVQAAARNRLQASIDALVNAAAAKPGRVWTSPTYEAWSLSPIAPSPAVGIANPASVFCESMGGTLAIVDSGTGQSGQCTLPDGSQLEEWAYYRATAPTLGQWPSEIKVPSAECTIVKASAFRAQWARANASGRWVLPGGQSVVMVFRPVLPGEQGCKRA